jgi:hypothetical protein
MGQADPIHVTFDNVKPLSIENDTITEYRMIYQPARPQRKATMVTIETSR